MNSFLHFKIQRTRQSYLPAGRTHASEAVFDDSKRKTLFWLLSVCVLALGLAYVWLINATVFHVVQLRHTAEEVRKTHTDLAPLEMEYLRRIHDITLSRAHEMGFIDVIDARFATGSHAPHTALLSSAGN